MYSPLIQFVHVLANLVWIGSILAVAMILAARSGDAVTRGEIASEVYKKLAVPAFVIAFAAGVLRLVFDIDRYFVATKFMHGKLLFALIVIALHHVIGARAKKMATGNKTDAGIAPTLSVILLVSATAAAFFAMLEPF